MPGNALSGDDAVDAELAGRQRLIFLLGGAGHAADAGTPLVQSDDDRCCGNVVWTKECGDEMVEVNGLVDGQVYRQDLWSLYTAISSNSWVNGVGFYRYILVLPDRYLVLPI
jgi:hypothetical protein